MSWIESHDSLARHPKTRRAARALSVSVPTMIGHLHCLWWWALEYADDGDLSLYDAIEIADGALWEGEPGLFINTLSQVGFVDMDTNGGLRIHDWQDYAGRLVEQRRANATKQRAWRERHQVRNDNVTVTSPQRNGATVPYQTIPNQDPPLPPQGDDAPVSAVPAGPPLPEQDRGITPQPKPKRAPGQETPMPPWFAAIPAVLRGDAPAPPDVAVDWAKLREWVAARAPDVDLADKTEALVQWAAANPTKARKANWVAFWQTCLRDEQDKLPTAARKGAGLRSLNGHAPARAAPVPLDDGAARRRAQRQAATQAHAPPDADEAVAI